MGIQKQVMRFLYLFISRIDMKKLLLVLGLVYGLISIHSCSNKEENQYELQNLYKQAIQKQFSFPDSALLVTQQCLDKALLLKDTFYFASCMQVKSRIAMIKGDLKNSFSYLDTAIIAAQSINNDTLYSQLLENKVRLYFQQEDWENTHKVLAQKEILDKRIQYRKGEIINYDTKLKLFVFGQLGLPLDSIPKIFNTAIQLCDTIKDIALISSLRSNMGFYYIQNNQLDKTVDLLEQQIDYYKKEEQYYNLYATYRNLSMMHDDMGNLQKSIEYLKQAVSITEQMNSKTQKISSADALALLYERFQLYQQAIDAYQYVTRDSTITADEHPTITTCYSKIGLNYHKLGIKDSAEYYLQKGKMDSEAIAYDRGRFFSTIHFTSYFIEEGNLDSAKLYLDTARTLRTRITAIYEEEADVYLNLKTAQIATKQQNSDQVPALIEAVLSPLNITSNEISARIVLKQDALATLAQYYQNNKKYKQANSYFLQVNKLKEQQYDNSKTALLLELNEQVNKSHDQFTSRSLLLEKKMQTVRLTTQKQLNKVLIGGILLSLGLLGIVLYLFQKSQKDNQMIREQSQALQALNKLKDRIFAVIGHDLRGPIGGIKTVLDMAANGELSGEEVLEMSGDMQKNTTAVYEILNNLLNWAKMQMDGQNTDTISTTNLGEEIEKVHEFLGGLIKQKHLNFKTLSPNISVKANTNDVNIVLRNLINNAIKFTPKGGTINLEVSSNKYPNMVQVAISDTGIGIPKKRLKDIFEIGKTTWGTDGEKGTGLGLNLSKEIIEKYNGRIWVESEDQKGTTFYFILPNANLEN